MEVIINEGKYALKQDINLFVARLNLKVLIEFNPSNLNLSPSQKKFVKNGTAGGVRAQAVDDVLVLKLMDQVMDRRQTWQKLIYRTKIWELWMDESGHYIFFNPLQPLLRQVIIDPNFEAGTIFGEFITPESDQVKPLSQDLEIVVFSNWLANYGDVILHASGVSYEGKGFIFAGDSGAGKSTLSAALSQTPGMTVLGEDQVVLRLINGKFWVFGTPWHINPSFCSPTGVPLEKIYFLSRNGTQGINNLSAADGVSRLLSTAFVPYYRIDAVEAIVSNLQKLSQQFNFKTLQYQLGTNVWEMIQG